MRVDKYFTVKTLRGQKNVSLDRLKSAYEIGILQDNVINTKGSKNSFVSENDAIMTLRARLSRLL